MLQLLQLSGSALCVGEFDEVGEYEDVRHEDFVDSSSSDNIGEFYSASASPRAPAPSIEPPLQTRTHTATKPRMASPRLYLLLDGSNRLSEQRTHYKVAAELARLLQVPFDSINVQLFAAQLDVLQVSFGGGTNEVELVESLRQHIHSGATKMLADMRVLGTADKPPQLPHIAEQSTDALSKVERQLVNSASSHPSISKSFTMKAGATRAGLEAYGLVCKGSFASRLNKAVRRNTTQLWHITMVNTGLARQCTIAFDHAKTPDQTLHAFTFTFFRASFEGYPVRHAEAWDDDGEMLQDSEFVLEHDATGRSTDVRSESGWTGMVRMIQIETDGAGLGQQRGLTEQRSRSQAIVVEQHVEEKQQSLEPVWDRMINIQEQQIMADTDDADGARHRSDHVAVVSSSAARQKLVAIDSMMSDDMHNSKLRDRALQTAAFQNAAVATAGSDGYRNEWSRRADASSAHNLRVQAATAARSKNSNTGSEKGIGRVLEIISDPIFGALKRWRELALNWKRRRDARLLDKEARWKTTRLGKLYWWLKSNIAKLNPWREAEELE